MSRRTKSSYCRAMCVLELLMLKRHILFVPDGDFTASDIDESRSKLLLLMKLFAVCAMIGVRTFAFC